MQRLTHRVDQLKQEDLCNREVTHEREIHSAMQISQSYEDLSLDTEILSCRDKSNKPLSSLVNQSPSPTSAFKHHLSNTGKTSPLNINTNSQSFLSSSGLSPRSTGNFLVNSSTSGSLVFASCSNSNPSDNVRFPASGKDSTSPLFPSFGSSACGAFKNHLISTNSKMLPLNVQTNHMSGTTPMLCSSPSPTRVSTLPRQCFSPNFNWKCSSPSPTRKSFATRRSLSPIAMRPSSFTLKRKFDLDIGSDEGPNTKKSTTQVFSQSGLFGCARSGVPTSGLVLSHNSDSNDKKDVTMSYCSDTESDKKEYINGETVNTGSISMILDTDQNSPKQTDLFRKSNDPVSFNNTQIQSNITMLYNENQDVNKPNLTEDLQTSQFTFRPVSNDICDNEETMNSERSINSSTVNEN